MAFNYKNLHFVHIHNYSISLCIVLYIIAPSTTPFTFPQNENILALSSATV